MQSPTRRGLLIGSIAAVICTAAIETKLWLDSPGMPRQAWLLLEDADSFELLSVSPEMHGSMKNDFHNHQILGRTIITDPAVRDELSKSLQSAARESNGSVLACFNPRHGIRVIRGGIATDFVICFECRQV